MFENSRDMATSMAGALSSLEPRMLNAAEEGNRKIHDRLVKIIDGNDVTTSVVAALTTESTAKTSQILHASHEFSDRLNEVVERNEVVYNAIIDLVSTVREYNRRTDAHLQTL